MALLTETGGGSCLQLELGEQLAAPEPPLKLVHPAAGTQDPAGNAGRKPAPVELGQYIASGTGGHGRARADALLAVIKAFACRVAVFGYDATRRDKFLIMMGARPVLDALDLLLPEIASKTEAAARAAVSAYDQEVRAALPQMPADEQRRVLKIPYFRDYMRGYGEGMAATIREIRTEFVDSQGPELATVLAEQDAQAQEVFDREFAGRQHLKKEQAAHRSARFAGQDAGCMADIGDEYLAWHDLVFAML